MKKMIALTILLVMMVCVGYAEPQHVKDFPQDGMYHPSYAIVYNPSDTMADMVKNPNSKETNPMRFFNGAAVTLIGWLGNWTLVSTGYGDDKIIGYVSSDHITYGKDMPAVASSIPTAVTLSSDGEDFVDVRRQPTEDTVITGRIDNGHIVDIYAISDDWCLVESATETEIVTGFVNASNLELTGGIAPINETALVNAQNNPN